MIVLFLFTMFSGCFHMSLTGKPYRLTINFTAYSFINQGILLPIDIITSKNSTFILEMGPDDWFKNNRKRNAFSNEIQHIAIAGGEKEKVFVYLENDIEYVIIYADYNEVSERCLQEVVIMPQRFRLNYEIIIKKNKMELWNE